MTDCVMVMNTAFASTFSRGAFHTLHISLCVNVTHCLLKKDAEVYIWTCMGYLPCVGEIKNKCKMWVTKHEWKKPTWKMQV
jgi:hypothetical protein